MKLIMDVGLDPGDIVLDGDPAPPKRGGRATPLFGPCLLWPNGRSCQLLMSTRMYLYDITTYRERLHGAKKVELRL